MSYQVFGILRPSIDQGLNPVYPRFSFFLRALYPKESLLLLVEFLQARFKNIEASFHHCKSLFVALFLSWRTRLCIFRSQRIHDFTLALFATMLLMNGSNSLYSLGIEPSLDDAMRSHRKFARRFAEGIEKLAGNTKGDHREEDRRTCRKIAGVCESKVLIRLIWSLSVVIIES
ncbi:hypothetical protein BHE74_00027896 [Ensete ventricosum]|nr:hypothetical protein GW17_00032997 [Ensete ventricosum]RWW64837.1 hypothetical protein BHE74_00027896 [Ensete ventricosum]